jgi:hypothetical protein
LTIHLEEKAKDTLTKMQPAASLLIFSLFIRATADIGNVRAGRV